MADHKSRIIEILQKLKERDFAKNEKWKARAYDTVIKQLKARTEPVTKIEDIDGMKGVGEKIRLKIDEIIKTGELEQVNKVDEEVAIVMELSKIFGIGPVRAREFYEKNGIKSIEDLKEKPELLNDKQKLGLKYYLDFEQRIPRKEMDKHAELIKNTILKFDSKFIVEIMGSYRRGLATSGDIDVLLTHPDDIETAEQLFTNIIDELYKQKYLVDTFAKGNKKYNGVCKLKRHRTNRRIDLMYTNKEQYPFALLYFTGSQNFNILMRNRALSMGYSLSEYGLKYMSGSNKGKFVEEPFLNENDVFKFLKMSNVDPKNRNDSSMDKYNLEG
jgi:DNA polymerase beta